MRDTCFATDVESENPVPWDPSRWPGDPPWQDGAIAPSGAEDGLRSQRCMTKGCNSGAGPDAEGAHKVCRQGTMEA